MHPRIFALLASAAGMAMARQNSNFAVSRTYAEEHACGEKCQRVLHLTNQEDLKTVGKDFAFDFYKTSHNFTATLLPGEVLKVEPMDPLALKVDAGTTVYRMQYTSRDLDGSTVPVTGFIAFPYTQRYSRPGLVNGTDRYRLAAFAHGTIGLFAGCAPSNSANLYDYDTWQAAVRRGYAVVATDYAGLGNSFTSHKYLTLPAQVEDLYYSVVAARKVFGHILTSEWVSFGHSQGGGAVWKLAESDYVKRDVRYLGTVALAPATYVVDMLLWNFDTIDFAGYLSFLPIALERVTEKYMPKFLSYTMRKRVKLAEESQLCINGMLALGADLNKTELVWKEGMMEDKDKLKDWQRLLSPAQGDTSPAPIMVLQGLNDTSVVSNTTEAAWNNACKAGNEVHLRLYAGQEHSALVQASAPEWLLFMDELFENAGNNSPNSTEGDRCTSLTRQPLDSAWVKQPPEGDPEFLSLLKDILKG